MPGPTRRALLAGAAAAGLAWPRRARAAVSAADRKFLFVFNHGGWDVTRVYAPLFDNAAVSTEARASTAVTGGVTWVDHPDRPSVRTFFSNWHDRSLILNGVLVPAISHELCTALALTGGTSGVGPDWPAVLGAARADRYPMPHLVAGGPAFSGDLGALVARTGANGQLQGLVDGSLRERSDIEVSPPVSTAAAATDAWLRDRVARRLGAAWAGRDAELVAAFEEARGKAEVLKGLSGTLDLSSGEALDDQARLAVEALAGGLSRCVSLVHPGSLDDGTWDSHSENDTLQSALFESLFASLNVLLAALSTTPGEVGGTLLDETVVVVLSEMGRSPQLNALEGKDHWPYTSALLVGAGITGDRVVGGYDDTFYGSLVDPATGEASPSGQILDAAGLGATLLALGDVDPGDWLDGVDPIEGILA